ncbi:hypothetical protein [Desulfobacula toluolica]|uniref:Uncharacterized protein n=1 Tax=Desulfobacula toluolica (strain DSM 7467 / Tol2) TaxID=651182 RepID=K0NRJ8_DESTT|nr:hypothetical protein [Desulfobacula toluolica]CCK81567.1 uncharacterized protein TOL2_C34100 [Desulfobacula toluolica Tol2]
MEIFDSIKDKFIADLTDTVSLQKVIVFVVFVLFLNQFHEIKKNPIISLNYSKEIVTESVETQKNIKVTTTEKFIEKKIVKKRPQKVDKLDLKKKYWEEPKSLWLILLKKNVLEVFSTSSGIIAKISLATIFSVIGLLFFLHFIYQGFKNKLFNLFSRFSKLETYIKELEEEAQKNKSDNYYFDTIIAINLDNQLSDKIKFIKRFANTGEILFDLSILCILSFFLKFYIDLIIGLFLFASSTFLYYKSFHYYLSHYLPMFLKIQILKNEPTIDKNAKGII